jgi:hypothetical protein
VAGSVSDLHSAVWASALLHNAAIAMRGDQSHFGPFRCLSIYNRKARGVDGGPRLISQFNKFFKFLGAKCTQSHRLSIGEL